jgi:HK97 gp10 family phage protein
MSIKFNFKGFDKALANIDKANKTQIKGLEDALENFGITTVREAKQRVPVDEGRLRNSISYQRKKGLFVEVIAQVDYAAYVEFGTRKFAAQYVSKLPNDWQTYAATFKGKGGAGSIEDMIERLTDWVLRKGLQTGGKRSKKGKADAENVAYVIAIRILQNGIKAQPYMFPAYEIARKQFVEEVKEIFGK